MTATRRPLSLRISSATLALIFGHASVQPVFALPRGERVTKGEASFTRDANLLLIRQGSHKAVIEYDGFDIGAAETVRFEQPGASAAALNRVVAGSASTIAGALQANGTIFLVNPAGILFTGTAQVDVHGLVAAAMNISDSDFMAGNLAFSGKGGRVVNEGTIQASFAYLVGGSVENNGTISSPDVVMQAGTGSIKLGEAEGGEINLVVSEDDAPAPEDPMPTVAAEADAPAPDAPPVPAVGDLVNRGTVSASGEIGGRILGGGTRVANLGSLVADGATGAGGEIRLLASEQLVLGPGSLTSASGGGSGAGGSITLVGGQQFVSAPEARIVATGGTAGGVGGFVETSGYQGFRIGAAPEVSGGAGAAGGTWRIDPFDIYIEDESPDFDFNQNMVDFFGNPWQPMFQDAVVSLDMIIDAFESGTSTLRINTADDQYSWFSKGALGGVPPSPQAGNIHFNADFDLDRLNGSLGMSGVVTATPTLILQAHENINMVGQIFDSDTGTPNALNLVLEADWSGSVDDIRGDPEFKDGPDLNGLGDVVIGADISTYGGYLFASGQNIIVQDGATVDSGAGEVRFTGDQDLDGAGLVSILGSVLSGGGYTQMSGAMIDITGTVDAGLGGLTLLAQDGISIGAEAIVRGGGLNLQGDTDNDQMGDVVADARLEQTSSFWSTDVTGQNVRLRQGVSGAFHSSLWVNAQDDLEIAGFDLQYGQAHLVADGDGDLTGALSITGNGTTGGRDIFGSGHGVRTSDGVSLASEGGDIVLFSTADVQLGLGGLLDTTYSFDPGDLRGKEGKEESIGKIHLLSGQEGECLGDVVIGSDLMTGGGDVFVKGVDIRGPGHIDTSGAPELGLGVISLLACDHIDVTGNYRSDGNAISLIADANADRIGDARSSGTMTTQGGSFLITGMNAHQSGAVATSGGTADAAARVDASLGSTTSGGGEVTVFADDDADRTGHAGVTGDISTGGARLFVHGESASTSDGSVLDTDGGYIAVLANSGITLGTGGRLDTRPDAVITGLSFADGSVGILGDQDANCEGAVLLGSDIWTGGAEVIVRGSSVIGGGGVSTAGGGITISACGDVTLGGDLQSGGGHVSLQADSDSDRVGDLLVTGSVSSGGGDVIALGRDADLAGGVTTAGGLLSLQAYRHASAGWVDTRSGAMGGDVLIRADNLDAGTGDATLRDSIWTGGANVEVSGMGISFAPADPAAIDTDGGFIDFVAQAGITLGAQGVLDTRPDEPSLDGGGLAPGVIYLHGDVDQDCVGDVLLDADLFTFGAQVLVHGANVIGGGDIATQGGEVRISACDDFDLTGTFETQGGAVILRADSDADGTGDGLRGGITHTGGGSFEMIGQNLVLSAYTTTAGGSVYLGGAGDVTVSDQVNSAGFLYSGFVQLYANSDSGGLTRNGSGVLHFTPDGSVFSGYSSIYGDGYDAVIEGSWQSEGGSHYLSAERDITVSGGFFTSGSRIHLWAGRAVDIQDGGTLDARDFYGEYGADISVHAAHGPLNLHSGSLLITSGHGDICLEAGGHSSDADILLNGEVSAAWGNIEAMATGDIVIGSDALVVTVEAMPGLAGDKGNHGYASGNILLIAGHELEYTELYDEEYEYYYYGQEFLADGAGDLVQLGGTIGSQSGNILGLGHQIRLTGGQMVAPLGTVGLLALEDAQVDNTLGANTLLVEADGSVQLGGQLVATDLLLVEANGGAITGAGLVDGARVGLKAHGGIGQGLGVNAAALLLLEQTAPGDMDLVLAGVGPTEGELAGLLNLESRCSSDGKSMPAIAYGPDILIRGQLQEEPKPPVRRPPVVPHDPGRPTPPAPNPPSPPAVDIAALLAKFFVDVPNFKERAKIFEEFFFLHLTMQISEFAMNLDLNFLDYLLFGEARIHANAPLPAEAKDTVYIGGIRPYRVIGGGKAPGYQGVVP